MKQITLVALTLFYFCAHAQKEVIKPLQLTNIELASKLESKAKSQKTLGIIMATGGSAVLLIGEVIYLKGYGINFTYAPQSQDDVELEATGSALMLIGAVLVAGSVPLLLAANKNKKRAKLTLSQTPISMFPKGPAASVPGVSVVVRL